MNKQFSPFPILESDRLILKQLKQDDAQAVFDYQSNKAHFPHVEMPVYYDLSQAEAYIEKMNDGIKSSNCIVWGIRLIEAEVLIGVISLWNFNELENKAEFGYSIFPAYRGKAYMQEALGLVINYGFKVMKLDTIEAYTAHDNKPSVSLLKKMNFKYIKTFEDDYLDGVLTDLFHVKRQNEGKIMKSKIMKEIKLLDRTLDLIDETGTHKAYAYLKDNLNDEESWSSQVYNFLYCFAATSGRSDEAMAWMHEAIVDKGLWYRPEVFEDEDLDTIRDREAFATYTALSDQRYREALKEAKTVFTWTEKRAENIIVVLHGNQQNNDISKAYWESVQIENYQVEYLQSSELDSYDLYRWSDDGNGPDQIVEALKPVLVSTYKRIILVGFSAACNAILKAIAFNKLPVDDVILLSPWMPGIEKSGAELVKALNTADIKTFILCGQEDEDCLPHCEIFEREAKKERLQFTTKYIEKLGHEYPDDLEAVIETLI